MVIKERVIMWDWNGTLLDDAEVCLTTMNVMLELRGLPTINLETYKELFSFPVIEYYKKIGFDFHKESFENLSVEFIDSYAENLDSANIVPGAEHVLKLLLDLGKENVIISAMKQDMLDHSVIEKGIESCFKDIMGADDIYAAGKAALALDYVKEKNLLAEDILFIGDTTHDYEVAEEIGCRCILMADGHQSEERLKATGAEVLPALTSLLPYIIPKSS